MWILYTFLACGEKTTSIDADNDGYDASVDCDDNSISIHPDALEICDSIDNNCNGDVDEYLPTMNIFPDADQDGFGSSPHIEYCTILHGYVLMDGDCNDNDPTINPLSDEICDDLDNDCNGTVDDHALDASVFYADHDEDGFGDPSEHILACSQTLGLSTNPDDCNDNDPTVHVNAIEICDGIDNDCDGLIDDDDDSLDPLTATAYYEDNDGDGFGDLSTEVLTCTDPGDYVDNGLDCDDSTIWSSPLITYDSCDGQDNDCDGQTDEDVKSGWPLVSIHEFHNGMTEINTTTAQVGTIHPLTNIGDVWSMDVSEGGVAIIHSDYGGLRLGLLDACNNQVTFLPPHNTSGIGCGISFGPNGKLYAINGNNDSLYEMNTTTGQATLIGPLGVDIENCGIAYDCTNDVLVGATSSTDQIFKINHNSGQAYDFIQTTVPLTISVGMEFDAKNNRAYLATETDLYQVDMMTGISTYIGNTGGGSTWYINDLAFHPPCP